jgi:hypothetical protein
MGKNVNGTEEQRTEDMLVVMIAAGVFRPEIKTLDDLKDAMWDSAPGYDNVTF